MKIDKLKNYSLELILCIILFFALFVPNIITRIALSVILVIFTIIAWKILKKRNIISTYHKQVTLLMGLFAVIYLIVFYLMGLYFGFYQATVKLSVWSVINYIIPITVIIISSEILRSIFLATNEKKSIILTTIAMILVDLIVYSNINNITNLEGFLGIVGFNMFSSIACNLLYNYISTRFGSKPIIAFRLITTLYAYIIPLIPNLYIFFRTFLRMIYPYFIYVILDYTYSKENLIAIYKDKKKSVIYSIVIIAIMCIVIMLISCQFKYGVLVGGSGSMTGTINKGDAVVFEKYDSLKYQDLEGKVIIFQKDNMKMIHRVVDVKNVNNEKRYYTKGDNNQQADEGYITDSQIIGVSKFRILYIGYPTIWIREIFAGN